MITGALYLLTIGSLPFSPLHATVFLFALVSFWSRLPGAGMPSPFYILYLADFVDFFSLIIAVNIGGFQGAMFSLAINLVSRAVGLFPRWRIVLEDSIAQFIVCLVIPFFHYATGGDIFTSMIIYSVLRMEIQLPMMLVPGADPAPNFLFDLVTAGPALLLVNGFYASIFGDYFDSLLQQGVQFNFILFVFV